MIQEIDFRTANIDEIAEFCKQIKWNGKFISNLEYLDADGDWEKNDTEYFHSQTVNYFLENVFFTIDDYTKYRIITEPEPPQYRAYTSEEFLKYWLRNTNVVYMDLRDSSYHQITDFYSEPNNVIHTGNDIYSLDEIYEFCRAYNPETNEFDILCGVEL